MRTAKSAAYQIGEETPVPIPGVFAFAYRLIRQTDLPDSGWAQAKRLLCWGQIWFTDADLADRLVDLNAFNQTSGPDLIITYELPDRTVRTKRFKKVIFGYGAGGLIQTLQQPVDDARQLNNWLPFLVSMPTSGKLADSVITT